MKNIIFIAPPAAGKGTMSSLLEEKYGYVHISTGDLLREAKNKNDELGNQLKEILSTGKLVSDDIVLKLLNDRICMDDCKKGFILDGYPRNVNQIDSLLGIFSDLNINDYAVIYLDIDYEKAMKRTLGRLICPNCKISYNSLLEATKPKVDCVCDKCGASLESRSDDTEETFKIRWDTYLSETKPVIDFFDNKKELVKVKVSDDLEETLSQIEKILEA